MKQILESLKKIAGKYKGDGLNHEGQVFVGVFSLQPILGGRGFSLRFSAHGQDGSLFHEEESIIAPAINEKLTLWNFNSNIPGLLPHELRASPAKNGADKSFVFGFNEASNAQEFREEIAIHTWSNGDLSYTYSWGMPGGEFKERSGARMARQ